MAVGHCRRSHDDCARCCWRALSLLSLEALVTYLLLLGYCIPGVFVSCWLMPTLQRDAVAGKHGLGPSERETVASFSTGASAICGLLWPFIALLYVYSALA